VLEEAGFVPPASAQAMPIEQQLHTEAEAQEKRWREKYGTGEGH
jgi:hypothetical protein